MDPLAVHHPVGCDIVARSHGRRPTPPLTAADRRDAVSGSWQELEHSFRRTAVRHLLADIIDSVVRLGAVIRHDEPWDIESEIDAARLP